MKLLIIFVVVFAVAQAGPLFNEEWETWKSLYSKIYAPEEEMKRQYIWQKNLQYVIQHNFEADQGKHTYRLHANEFADMDEDEWRTLMTGTVTRPVGVGSFCNMSYVVEDHFVAPKMVDWRTKGYVTPVKNQKQCGSCWAFSATGSLEGQHFKKTGMLVSLSEQNLIDCSKMEGNMGCKGGLMDNAFKYIFMNHGIDTEMSYPYKAMDEPSCEYTKKSNGATLSGCVDIEKFSETGLQSAVSRIGPISVAIDAGHKSFQLYHSGVYYEPQCSSTHLDHGVLAVGYGAEDGQDYWLVKNSWGATWGMDGYIMMSRNKKNNCGIATQASYPVV